MSLFYSYWYLLALAVILISTNCTNYGSNSNSVKKLEVQHGYAYASSLQFDSVKTCLLNKGVNSSSIVQRDFNDDAEQYKELNYQWNLESIKTPIGYVVADSVEDIQNAVICCKNEGLRLVARSGGHSYGKYSYGNSRTLVLDLQKLTNINVDAESRVADIEPGQLIGSVRDKLNEYNFVLPLGSCPTVGISGLTLGGGYGWFARTYGLTQDHVLEFDMVDSSGTLLTINNKSNSDLFWALRGGGAGSFGIVTKFKFELSKIPTLIEYSQTEYELMEFPKVFSAWQSLISSNPPDSLTAVLYVYNRKIKLYVFVIILDQIENPKNSGKILLENSLASFPPTEHRSVKSLTYPEFSQILTNTTELHKNSRARAIFYPSTYFQAKSFFVKNKISSSEIYELFYILTQIPSNNNMTYIRVQFSQVCGAIDKLKPNESAFIHRGQNLYLVQLYYYVPESQSHDIRPQQIWLKDFFDLTKNIMRHTESYQNYIDTELPNYLERYYGSNLHRLIKIKREVDPENFFRHPQSIPVY